METEDHTSLKDVTLEHASKTTVLPRHFSTSPKHSLTTTPLPASSVSSPTNSWALLKTCNKHMEQSIHYLLNQQDPRGFWVAELEADSTLTSEYIMLRRMLHKVDPDKERKKVSYLKAAQCADGGWPIYYGGPSNISASVKAYFALKLAGISPDEPLMLNAREIILKMGGVVKTNVFTKIALALFDQYDWHGIPSIPPEIILLPKQFPGNIHSVSYWSRVVLVPLLIIYASQPVKQIPKENSIDELYVVPRDKVRIRKGPPFETDPRLVSWRNLFLLVDFALHLYSQRPLLPLRGFAIKKATDWMLERMQGNGGLGAIYPAMANSVLALHALGYETDHPLIGKALSEIEELEVESDDMLHLQPCFSPIWDTCLLTNALVESGLSQAHPALLKAGHWMLSKQTKKVGDWKISAPQAQPGGWSFQFENELYPDCDDTAVVLMALAKLNFPNKAEQRQAILRGLHWLLAMQSHDGGWASYDKDNNATMFNEHPFADHKSLIDHSTADIAGRVLELLGVLGFDQTFPPAQEAIAYLKNAQETNGSWYGRWGVNYIYGTWSVLAGLRSIGEDLSQPYICKAIHWLKETQHDDGGWGESCQSYTDPSLAGVGESTASQTAWALIGLLCAGEVKSDNVTRGIESLIRSQKSDGSWEESFHTGTGFPRVFYLRYHWYGQYFPLWALSMYQSLKTNTRLRADDIAKRNKAQKWYVQHFNKT
ncbi:MAG: squalene--hopene cyclase [Nitrospiraceae bacterium]|nr:squalene--hopene cyclase [Nitrospiraceae bacterium]|tara:strand:+ start:3768 stop:5903 length:2136 start_codon:yes stop_codon:yes gene_type:complete